MYYLKLSSKYFRLTFTLALLFTVVYLRPWISPKVHALTFTDNSAATFNTGTYTLNSQYNTIRNGVDGIIPAVAGNGDRVAIYDSAVKNAGSSATWDSLTWTQEQKYEAEMPTNGGADTGFTQNLSMANNQVYYRFNETSISPINFADSSGNGNNITLNGGVSPALTATRVLPTASPGAGAGAIFAGNSNNAEYYRLPTGVSSRNQSSYTISLWFAHTNATNTTGTRTLYEEAQGTSTNPRLSLRMVNNVIQFAGRPLDSDNTTTTWVSATQPIALNLWYHVVAVYDSTSTTNNIKLYVNGVQNSGSFTVPTISNTANASNLPRILQGMATNTRMRARMDEFATFTRALSAQEVQNMYRRGAWRSMLFARSCAASPCTTETYKGPTGGTFPGPNGALAYTSTSFNTPTGFINNNISSTNTVTLNPTHFPANQYFQYRIFHAIRLTDQGIAYSTGSISSIVNSVSVDYTPAIPTPTLSFAVRNTTDTANTYICSLGTATPTILSTCSYRLKVGTNSTSGYILYVKTSTGLSNGTYNTSNAVAGSGGSGGTDISSSNVGTEKYGVVISPGSITGSGSISRTTAFNATSNSVLFAYPTTATAMLQSTGINSPISTDTTNTSLVTHKLNISKTTPPGNYTQKVTYTVSSTF
jgi:hypothetical protein